jgi:hypothetical protein
MRINAAAALAAAGWSLAMPGSETITMSQNAFGIAYAWKV